MLRTIPQQMVCFGCSSISVKFSVTANQSILAESITSCLVLIHPHTFLQTPKGCVGLTALKHLERSNMSRANLAYRLFIGCISSGERFIIQFSILVQRVINGEGLGRGGFYRRRMRGTFYGIDSQFLLLFLHRSAAFPPRFPLCRERAHNPAD